jgi:DNA-binding winged helix-turn-helix (wHTH) protein
LNVELPPSSAGNGSPGRNTLDASALSLARRPDFRLASALVRPSLRSLEGPGGALAMEPRVMHVLLAFVDSQGAVLTRDELMRSCWSGAVVGDDAINRAISEIRRISRTTQSGFSIETIPRVGYRLTGTATEPAQAQAQASPEAAQPEPLQPASSLYRRRWLIGGALAALGSGAFGLWRARRPGPDPRFEEQMERGLQALRLEMPGSSQEAAGAFRIAAEIEPQNASAWGLLALALRGTSDFARPEEAGAAMAASEAAARRALSFDEREPNALVTLALLQRRIDNWMTTESRLRDVLAIAPENAAALDYLTSQLQAAGYIRESWDLNEQAIAFDPLRPTPLYRKALKLWILGRWDEADQVAARALELWPQNLPVKNARLLVYAFTDRWQAARQFVDRMGRQEKLLSPAGVTMWKASLAALESRTPHDVQVARDSSLAAAPLNPGLSVHAVLLLSAMGEVDAAFSVVEGFMLRRGLLVTQDRTDAGNEYEVDMGWRETQWLFTPATKSLRADPRFAVLCDAIGLSQYWQQRGVLPDERRA